MNLSSHRSRVVVFATAYLVLSAIGFGLSLAYGQVRGWDEAIGTPWTLTIVFALAALLMLRADRWGLLGAVVSFLVPAAYLGGGQVSAPLTWWAYGHNFGLALYITLALSSAAAMVIVSGWELWLRARNRGRLASATGGGRKPAI